MNVETKIEADIYSHERATLREHLEVLNGRTTWREPDAGHSTVPRSVPYEHTLAAALAWARDHEAAGDDVGPDILESLVYRRRINTDRVCDALVKALRDISARLNRVDDRVLRRAAFVVFSECVTGMDASRPKGMRQVDWSVASALAIRLIWASAGQTIRRAAESLK